MEGAWGVSSALGALNPWISTLLAARRGGTRRFPALGMLAPEENLQQPGAGCSYPSSGIFPESSRNRVFQQAVPATLGSIPHSVPAAFSWTFPCCFKKKKKKIPSQPCLAPRTPQILWECGTDGCVGTHPVEDKHRGSPRLSQPSTRHLGHIPWLLPGHPSSPRGSWSIPSGTVCARDAEQAPPCGMWVDGRDSLYPGE